MGDVLQAQGDLPGALHAFRSALQLAEHLVRHDPANATWQSELSLSQQRIGDVLFAQGELLEAAGLIRRSVEVRQALADAHPDHPVFRRDLASSQEKLDKILRLEADLRHLFADIPANAAAGVDLGRPDTTFGESAQEVLALYDAGDLDAALTAAETHEQRARALGDRSALLASLEMRCRILIAKGQALAVMPLLAEQADLCRAIGDRHRLLGLVRLRAAALFAAACYAPACPLLEEQESLAREQNDPALLREAEGNRGVIHRLRGDHAAALARFHEEEALRRQLDDARELAGNLWNQARVLGDGMGRHAEALAKAEEAVRVASAPGLEQTLAEVQPLRDRLRAAGP